MTPEFPTDPRQALEVSLTALILGELPADQAEFMHRAMAQDAELARMHERLKQTIGLVCETEATPAEKAGSGKAPLKLSEDRREKLLAHFKTVAPKEFAPVPKREISRRALMAIAAVLLAFVGLSGMLLPSFSHFKAKSKGYQTDVASSSRQVLEELSNDLRSCTLSKHAVEETAVTEGVKRDEIVVRQRLAEARLLARKAEERLPSLQPSTPAPTPPPASAPAASAIVLPQANVSEVGHPQFGGFGAAQAGRADDKLAGNRRAAQLAMEPMQSKQGNVGLDGGVNFYALATSNTASWALGEEPSPKPSISDLYAYSPANADAAGGLGGGAARTYAPMPAVSAEAPALAFSTDGKPQLQAPVQTTEAFRRRYGLAPGTTAAGALTLSTDNQPSKHEVVVLPAPDQDSLSRGGLPEGLRNSAAREIELEKQQLGREVRVDPSTGLPIAADVVAGDASVRSPRPTETDFAGAAILGKTEVPVLGLETAPQQRTMGEGKKLNEAADARSLGQLVQKEEGLAETQKARKTGGFSLLGPTTEADLAARLAPPASAAPSQTDVLPSGSKALDVMKGQLDSEAKAKVGQTSTAGGNDSLNVVGYANVSAPPGYTMLTNELKPGSSVLEEAASKDEAAGKLALEALTTVGKERSLLRSSVLPDEGKKPEPVAPPPVPQPEIQTAENAFSTFSLNVSDVSFKLAAASLDKGTLPEPASIRSEEFINAFDYRDPEPPPGVPVAFAWERARYPFAQSRDLLRFSIKTAAQGRAAGRPLNLVLLLDNSGSMERADRVQIIREALRVLASQLQPQDTLSLITFARTARLWVDGVPGTQAAKVFEEVSGLTPQGGTNLEEAMNLAYQTALRHYQAAGINRVVLLTDGAANLGEVNADALKKKVEDHRKQGVALDCFGIGWEGYNDDLLEVLSRNGDGRYGFINTPEEAATGFATQLAGALNVAASDVKVQVEFNANRVTAYRQIGYAKHQLTKEQFRDNKVDAAEIGAAEAGNALYVVEVNPRGEGALAIVRVRYKVPGTAEYHEHEWAVPYNGGAAPLEQSSPAMRLAATASAFSEWLAASPYAAEVTPDRLLGCLGGVPEIYGADARPKTLDSMIRQAKSLAGK